VNFTAIQFGNIWRQPASGFYSNASFKEHEGRKLFWEYLKLPQVEPGIYTNCNRIITHRQIPKIGIGAGTDLVIIVENFENNHICIQAHWREFNTGQVIWQLWINPAICQIEISKWSTIHVAMQRETPIMVRPNWSYRLGLAGSVRPKRSYQIQTNTTNKEKYHVYSTI
jgi:hypothetical protein